MPYNYHSEIPREITANLQWRADLRVRAANDAGLQRAMLAMCQEDVLAWMIGFAWCFEPRPKAVNGIKQPKTLPFIPWEHQEPIILQLRQNLGVCDIGLEKSRGEGMSWILILMALHDWLFDPQAKIGLVSRTEDEADDPDNMDSLFAKIDWELTKLPVWMVGVKGADWDRNRSKHSLTNFRNGAQINADAATGAVFRGGRLKWAGMDEFAFFNPGEDAQALASSHGATNSRLFISTVNGTGNEYHRVMHEPSNMLKIVMDWKANPTRNRGLYRLENGKPAATDSANPLPKYYDPPDQGVLDMFSRLRRKGFKLEGKVRSPWYDRECDRPGATPFSIAQELDRDYGGSMEKQFGVEFQGKVDAAVRPPRSVGNLSYNPETLEPAFDYKDFGPLALWLELTGKLRPPEKQYLIGCDISTGLGGNFTSNSVASVIDQVTMEQVAELVTNTTPPNDFADLCIALAKWFWNAQLAWETNGPGEAFTSQVKRRLYGNLYYRRVVHVRSEKKTTEIGWHTNTRSKLRLFYDIDVYVRALGLKVRSQELGKEFGQYVLVNGEPQHVMAATNEDHATKGKSHGDRVIAFGVAVQALRSAKPISAVMRAGQDFKQEPPVGSMAWRNAQEEAAKKEYLDGWDDRDNWDIAAGRRLHW